MVYLPYGNVPPANRISYPPGPVRSFDWASRQHPGAQTRLVSCPRLAAWLDEGLRPGSKLTPVSAPAGFGKTTLLSEITR